MGSEFTRIFLYIGFENVQTEREIVKYSWRKSFYVSIYYSRQSFRLSRSDRGHLVARVSYKSALTWPHL